MTNGCAPTCIVFSTATAAPSPSDPSSQRRSPVWSAPDCTTGQCPQRFCYGGSVFRYLEPQAGQQREFWQIGGELIGASTPSADAEVLALTAASLQVADLTDYRLILGHIGYYRSLLQALALTQEQSQRLQYALNRKSEPLLADFLRDTPLRTGQRQAVETLPHLVGSDIDSILSQAERHIQNSSMHEALQGLRRIVEALAGFEVLDNLTIDLTEIRNLGYYTGISFEALTPGLGTTVGSGGRYDNLVGHFGPPQPAVGVALGVDLLLLARNRQQADNATAKPRHGRPALALAQGSAAALAEIQLLRAAGLPVQLDVNDWSVDSALDYAAQTGIADVLQWDDGFLHHRSDGDGGFDLLGPLDHGRLSHASTEPMGKPGP